MSLPLTAWLSDRAYLARRREPKDPPTLPKGCCRVCGKQIGRGVRFHEKRCEG